MGHGWEVYLSNRSNGLRGNGEVWGLDKIFQKTGRTGRLLFLTAGSRRSGPSAAEAGLVLMRLGFKPRPSRLRSKAKVKININVKGVGQKCLTHTGR